MLPTVFVHIKEIPKTAISEKPKHGKFSKIFELIKVVVLKRRGKIKSCLVSKHRNQLQSLTIILVVNKIQVVLIIPKSRYIELKTDSIVSET